MKCNYSRELTILPSMCDLEGKLGVPNAFALFMDIATEHAERLGVGMNDLMPRGLFWLTVRVKARFHRRPGMTETVTVATWPEVPERSRCNRDYVIEKDGEVLVEGRTEWMVMDLNRGRLMPTDRVFPQNLDIDDRQVLSEPFLRLSEDYQDAEELGAYTVRATDIDVGGHMNNAAYIRALVGAFTSEQWKEMNVREMEVSYRSPCFEGNELILQKRERDGGTEVRFSHEGKTIFLARMC